MKRLSMITVWLASVLTASASADTVLYSYDGDILPSNPASGLIVGDACDGDCSALIDSGHFVMEWGSQGNDAEFGRIFSDERPPTLWVEWRFRSNQPKPSFSFACDARVETTFGGISELTYMFQDWVVDFSGSDFVSGLAPGVFHTYRFESLDGANYTMAADGLVFNVDFDPDGNFYKLAFGGGVIVQ